MDTLFQLREQIILRPQNPNHIEYSLFEHLIVPLTSFSFENEGIQLHILQQSCFFEILEFWGWSMLGNKKISEECRDNQDATSTKTQTLKTCGRG